MKIYLGADHRGHKLKEVLKKELKIKGYEVIDMGAEIYDGEDDYVDYAIKVCKEVSGEDRGVLICGSGHGVELVANRFGQIRAVLGFNLDVVVQGREDENANVLSLPADWITEEEATDMIEVFLKTEFSKAERHIRRLKKIENIS